MTFKCNKGYQNDTFPLFYVSSSNYQDDLRLIFQFLFFSLFGAILYYLNIWFLYVVKIFNTHKMLGILFKDLQTHTWINGLVIESFYAFPIIKQIVQWRSPIQSYLLLAKHQQVKMYWTMNVEIRCFSPDSANNLLLDFRWDNWPV